MALRFLSYIYKWFRPDQVVSSPATFTAVFTPHFHYNFLLDIPSDVLGEPKDVRVLSRVCRYLKTTAMDKYFLDKRADLTFFIRNDESLYPGSLINEMDTNWTPISTTLELLIYYHPRFAEEQKLKSLQSFYSLVTEPSLHPVLKLREYENVIFIWNTKIFNSEKNFPRKRKLKKETKKNKRVKLSESALALEIFNGRAAFNDLFPTLDPNQSFKNWLLLGEGSYGKVYVAERDGVDKAIKFVSLSNKKDVSDIKYLLGEQRFHTQLDHKNIVKYEETYVWDQSLWFVIELMYIDLEKFILQIPRDTRFPDGAVAHIMKEGLDYLHSLQIIHRDIKPANILISPTGEIKIGDLGFSVALKNGLRESVVGSPMYMAPERNLKEKYSKKSDIWSVGILCYELVQQGPIFDWMTEIKELKAFLQNTSLFKSELDKTFSSLSVDSNTQSFISECLKYLPRERPDTKTLLQVQKVILINKQHKFIHSSSEEEFLAFLKAQCM